MSRLDDLPPDQRAVLLLLVQQGKSHAEIADMLGISRNAVRDRARAALEALAGGPGESPVPAPQPVPDDRGRARTSGARTPGPPSPTPPPPPGVPEGTREADSSSSLPSSRRGGALLLALLVVVVVVVVILVTSGGGSHKAASTAAGTTTAGTTTPGTTTSSSGSTTSGTSKKAASPTVDKQIPLTSPEPNSKAVGLAEVFSEGSKRAFYIAAEHLPPSTGFFYAVWLYNSPTSALALSKSPAVAANGRLQGGALLPATAGNYREMLLTRETSSRPTHPGPVVLRGAFSLG
ncbi:MAG TPA: sigma-70 region 4 domain-containing protein [Solirubrobacteraceae bacterium]